MNKAKRNFVVDTVIGIAFVIAAISAGVFLVPTSWIDFSASTTPTLLGVDFGVWQTLHKWTGIVMIVGVVVHQLLHWSWITSMAKKIVPSVNLPKRSRAETPAPESVS